MPDKKILGEEMIEQFTPNTDFLTDIFKAQEIFMRRFFPYYQEFDQRQKENITHDLLACMTNEIEEIRDWTNWKHWKKAKYPINETELKFEIIDLLHFLIELALLWGITPQYMFNMYMSKMKENIRRQENGY